MKVYIEKNVEPKSLQALGSVKRWDITPLDINSTENIKNLEVEYLDEIDHAGKRWAIPVPKNPGTMFIIDYTLHNKEIESYAGATFAGTSVNADDRITIIIFGKENAEILELRIVHELVHGRNLPADDIVKYKDKFLGFLDRIFWQLLGDNTASPMPYFQRKFYNWLLKYYNS